MGQYFKLIINFSMPLIALQLFASYQYSRDNITIKFITRLLINTREVIAKNNPVMSKLMIFFGNNFSRLFLG